jgi:NAD-dependent deacetylase
MSPIQYPASSIQYPASSKDALISRAVDKLKSASHVAALTGAGISIDSGIPPFRGKGGLWERFDPMEIASIDAFLQDPARVWKVLVKDLKDIIDRARPNDAHIGLARLEQMGILKTIITQNIDGLHQMAGNADVIEFHGTFAWQRCMLCDRRIPTRLVDASVLPPRCGCSGILRPDAVFFGELIPPEALWRSQEIAASCEVMLVLGTSAVVQPAASMPGIAKESGAVVIEINPEPTPLTGSVSDFLIQGKAGEIMQRIVAELEKER